MKIFYAGQASENLLRLRSMGKCLGIVTELFEVTAKQSLVTMLKEATAKGEGGVVLEVGSLKERVDPHELEQEAGVFGNCDTNVLLLAADNTESTNRFLQIMSGGRVCRVEQLPAAKSVKFPLSGRFFSRELASQTFPRQAKEALALGLTPDARTNVIMELDSLPAFVSFHSGIGRVFVWSTANVFDVCQPLNAEIEFELASDEYTPFIMFLRSAFGDRCWHNPEVGAGIVIDDPLLKINYGFIDFRDLLDSARKHRYHVTLAFIPWNHWRSRRREVKLFLDYSDCFSVCFHGCDHTPNEYGLADYDTLLRKNFVAWERMQRHAYRTALRSEPLMVCPQEKYSLQAMHAFSDCRRFLGLVCTACMPRNLVGPSISGADLLLPAQDSFFGFPVFKRHYSNGMGAFAMAMFLGKPAILVEHHEFFRGGLAGVEQFVRRLSELRPDLKWRSLMQTVTTTHTRRRVSEHTWEVRFFTDAFHLKNEQEKATKYSLVRRIPETTHVERVRVSGEDVPFSREKGFLTFEVHTRYPQTVFIQVDVAPIKPTKAYSLGVKYEASVALRRGLSEFRDNVAVRSRFSPKAAGFVTKFFRQIAR